MSRDYSVYKHTTPSGKVYIGITRKAVKDRWLNGRGYDGQVFGIAVKKYGWENIKHEVVASGLTEQEASAKERWLISFYDATNPMHGYNKTTGGEKHFTLTPDVIEKTSGANNARARAILQYDLKGNYVARYETLTEAAIAYNTQPAHISGCANGDRISTQKHIWLFEDDPELEEKLRDKVWQKAHGGGMWSKGNHQAKKIAQYTKDGKYVTTYGSIADAARAVGVHYSTISGCVNTKKVRCKSAGGYIWKFA